ncbi:hypothetical protein F7230_00570 [Corynebacterium sp. 320]|uniref:lycopene cyclase family protein n=1 Tax=Corynebacterium TaxID=1716 RepID=UPI00125CBFEB|nr:MULTISPECIES: lycopene cyclase family protein [Corynebacterium]KAB1503661.1 hypothetical protein F7230_00570 [Corynebacterium sp. 320]KAB1553238.1 hypothetical protein F7233_06020 [Corynebacterium sp. 321]KAB1553543.1 hypothetical protein F7232_00565 [Corynebacterium sp. 319]KAB3527797.1 hypothetical protein F8354_00570 [Corynebacterium sp. 250]KAB3540714.1 hypothetical protein F8390_05765 [Corynebacterium sp. 366]
MDDLHILGAGPAGAFLALRAAHRGLRPHIHDPRGLRVWPATYGILDAQHLPSWLLPYLSAPYELRVVARETVSPDFHYRILDNAAVVEAVRQVAVVHTESVDAEGIRQLSSVSAASSALPVVDCTGAPRDNAAFQIAVGVVMDKAAEPTFMDWSPSGELPSFLYVQNLPDGTLFEETLLAHRLRPSAEEYHRVVAQLREQLRDRLDAQGVVARDAFDSAVLREEHVCIPMGTRAQARDGSVCFGARAGLINPATGYSVAHSAAWADTLLDEILGIRQSWRRWVAAQANKELAFWLRNLGAELIMRAEGDTLQDFFQHFFRLETQHQVAYLEGHNGLGVARTMWTLRKHTGIRHAFLQPLWRSPWRILGHTLRRGRRQCQASRRYTEKPR